MHPLYYLLNDGIAKSVRSGSNFFKKIEKKLLWRWYLWATICQSVQSAGATKVGIAFTLGLKIAVGYSGAGPVKWKLSKTTSWPWACFRGWYWCHKARMVLWIWWKVSAPVCSVTRKSRNIWWKEVMLYVADANLCLNFTDLKSWEGTSEIDADFFYFENFVLNSDSRFTTKVYCPGPVGRSRIINFYLFVLKLDGEKVG